MRRVGSRGRSPVSENAPCPVLRRSCTQAKAQDAAVSTHAAPTLHLCCGHPVTPLVLPPSSPLCCLRRPRSLAHPAAARSPAGARSPYPARCKPTPLPARPARRPAARSRRPASSSRRRRGLRGRAARRRAPAPGAAASRAGSLRALAMRLSTLRRALPNSVSVRLPTWT